MEAVSRNLDLCFQPFAKALAAHNTEWNYRNPFKQVVVFEAGRSFQRQAELYDIGRTKPGEPCKHDGLLRPVGSCPVHPLGLKVTNAPEGMSWHNYLVAADNVFDADPVKPGPQHTWDGKFPWMELGASLQAAGFEWAGAWKTFPEYPHAQMTYGMQITEALEIYTSSGRDVQAVHAAMSLTIQARGFRR